MIYTLHFSLGIQTISTRIPWTGWPTFFAGLLLLHMGVACSLWKGRAQKPIPEPEA
jgi:hypothetical protein